MLRLKLLSKFLFDSRELIHGVPVFDSNGNRLGDSKVNWNSKFEEIPWTSKKGKQLQLTPNCLAKLRSCDKYKLKETDS